MKFFAIEETGCMGYSFSGKDSPKSMDFLWIFMDILWTLWIIFSRRTSHCMLEIKLFWGTFVTAKNSVSLFFWPLLLTIMFSNHKSGA